MITIVEKNKCIGCGACASSCPKHCIEMQFDEEGFLYPHILQTSCMDCGLCKKACPAMNPEVKVNPNVLVMGCYAQNMGVKMQSSSGGLFALLVDEFWRRYPDGMVFGAIYDDQMRVVHHAVTCDQGIAAMRGSKYVQSDTQHVFQQVMQFLKEGKAVYFSGTPCEVAALKTFLGKDDELLYTQAILCHGAPSPKLWEYFVTSQEASHQDKMIDARFRDKTKGWEQYRFVITFERDGNVPILHEENWYNKAFGAGLSLRSSCYACQFKYPNYHADITIGDFWNVKEFCPKLYEHNGVSLAFVTTAKGESLFSAIEPQLVLEQVTPQRAIQSQKGIVAQVKKPLNRANYFEEVRNNPQKVTAKYTRSNLMSRVRRIVSRMRRQIIYLLKK